MSAVAGDLPLLARSLLALAAVLALLLGAKWVLARRGVAGMAQMGLGAGLHIAESLAVDASVRLVVIRRGEAEMVLAIGPHGVSQLHCPESRDRLVLPAAAPAP